MRVLVALAATLLSFVAQAQTFPHAGVFPGRLPGDIASLPPPPPLASPWTQGDVGSPPAGNNATSSGNVLTDVCKGEVGFTADTGHHIYQALSGDQEMIGKVPTSITSDTVWSRYAPGARQSPTAPGSKYAAFFFDHRNQVAFNWRLALDAHNDYVGFDTPWTAGQYWRITRVGNSFSGYLGPSSTGPWTLNGQQAVTMSDPIYWDVLCENGADANAATIVYELPTINALAGGSAGTVQFSNSAVSVNENGGAVSVVVPRTGGSTGAGSVVVSRAGSSTAVVTTDYTVSCALPCTLSWTNGDAADKSFTVTPVNRAGSQVSRHLDLSLGSASTVTVGSPSTQIITINDVSSGAATKWDPGYYADCYIETPYGGDQRLALGNVEWNAAKTCMDFWSGQPNIKGVFIGSTWTSWEGDSPGCYDATCSNSLGGAGTIGDPLLDALLNYAQSKGLRVILAIDWFNEGYGSCGEGYNTGGALNLGGPAVWVPKQYIQSSCAPGTDASNTYGVTLLPSSVGGWMADRLWKAAEMTAYMAMAAHVAARGDNHPALEAVIPMHQEGDCSGCEGLDGFNANTLSTQIARIPAAVKPSMPHTNLLAAVAWTSHPEDMLANGNSTALATGIFINDWKTNETEAGQAAFLGLLMFGTLNTHNYQTELPNGIWRAPTEYCNTRYGFHWVQSDLQNTAMVTGTTDAATGHPVKPNYGVVGRNGGLVGCPADATQQWGTPSSGGLNQQIQALPPLNATCPSRYASCAATTVP